MKTNEELRKDVMDEIKWNPILRDVATEIGVSAKDGVITLSGLVNTYSKKIAAEKAAQRVAGVSVVAVDLKVKLSGIHNRTDIELAEAVKNALKWNSAVNEDQIEVKVEDGGVYLDGIVDWEYQKRAAELEVRDLIGVCFVINRVTVKAKAVEPSEIKSKISAAFERSANVDSAAIQTIVVGSRVTLKGKIRSWAELVDAENAAWSSPGVTSVDNKLEVGAELFV